jgi:hypothetical protein
MAYSRWLILPGALIILGVLCIGVFSLGVYIGRHGLSQDGLQYQAPRQNGAPPQDGAPAPAMSGLPQRNPETAGIIRRITRDQIDIGTRDGPRTILLEAEVEIRLEDGQLGTRSDLHVGDLVAVFGRWNGGAARELKAEAIVRLPKK